MRTMEQILKAYKNADRIGRDNMWYRFVALRGAFDEIERYGNVIDMEARSAEVSCERKTDTSSLCNDAIEACAQRVQYSDKELERFHEGGNRIRHVQRLSKAASLYSIRALVVESLHCNAGHKRGQVFLLDVNGNFITKHCPKKMCVYLVSQLTIPVAQINERLSEGQDPGDSHFMQYVHCPDVGVECFGYGQVMIKIQVVPRVN